MALRDRIHAVLESADFPGALQSWRMWRRTGGFADSVRCLVDVLERARPGVVVDEDGEGEGELWAMVRLAVDREVHAEARIAALHHLWRHGRPDRASPPAARPSTAAPQAGVAGVVRLDGCTPVDVRLDAGGDGGLAALLLRRGWPGETLLTAFQVLQEVWGTETLTPWNAQAPGFDGTDLGRFQRLLGAALPSAVEPAVLRVTTPGCAAVVEVRVQRWRAEQADTLRRATREIACWAFHVPVHAWFLSHASVAPAAGSAPTAPLFRGGRIHHRHAVLAPLDLVAWEMWFHDDAAGAALRHADTFRRFGEAGRTEGHWTALCLDDEQDDGAEGDREEEDAWWLPQALWHASLGAVIGSCAESEGWLLPPPARNLPRRAERLARVLEGWLLAEEVGPLSHDHSRLERMQAHLDALHASRDPVVRLALRLNLARFEPVHQPVHLPRDLVGMPSPVAYAASYQHLLALAR